MAGGGHVGVSFENQNGKLVCSIQDNGQGRVAAARQQDTAKSHESRALSITKRRLELLEKEDSAECGFEIIDLKEPGGMPAGTRVVLTLPLL